MMRGRAWLIALLILATGGALALWIAAHLERGTRQVWVGYQGEARYNDFLAAERLLERMEGHPRSLWRLPSDKDLQGLDALVMPRRSRRLSPVQVAEVLAWVERGGILFAEGAWTEEGKGLESQDPLFAVFGVRMRFVPAPTGPVAPLTVRVDREAFDLEMPSLSILETQKEKPRVAISDAFGPRFMSFRRGKVEVVLMTSLAFLDNEHLAKADHAPFLVALLAGRRQVGFVVREEAPSLWPWLKARAPLPLAILGLLILLALWRGFPRFGPLMPDPEPGRRSLLEHLAACGRFQWRHCDGRSLLKASREAMMARLQRVHPAWTALPPDQLCARLASFSGLPEPRIFQALRYDAQVSARDFLDALQTLDLLRKNL